jgi:hypothetical protein
MDQIAFMLVVPCAQEGPPQAAAIQGVGEVALDFLVRSRRGCGPVPKRRRARLLEIAPAPPDRPASGHLTPELGLGDPGLPATAVGAFRHRPAVWPLSATCSAGLPARSQGWFPGSAQSPP